MAAQLFDSLQEVEAPLVSEQQLARVHPPHYVEYIEACSPSVGTFRVDPDTAMCPGTLQAARRAAGRGYVRRRARVGSASRARRPPAQGSSVKTRI